MKVFDRSVRKYNYQNSRGQNKKTTISSNLSLSLAGPFDGADPLWRSTVSLTPPLPGSPSHPPLAPLPPAPATLSSPRPACWWVALSGGSFTWREQLDKRSSFYQEAPLSPHHSSLRCRWGHLRRIHFATSIRRLGPRPAFSPPVLVPVYIRGCVLCPCVVRATPIDGVNLIS